MFQEPLPSQPQPPPPMTKVFLREWFSCTFFVHNLRVLDPVPCSQVLILPCFCLWLNTWIVLLFGVIYRPVRKIKGIGRYPLDMHDHQKHTSLMILLALHQLSTALPVGVHCALCVRCAQAQPFWDPQNKKEMQSNESIDHYKCVLVRQAPSVFNGYVLILLGHVFWGVQGPLWFMFCLRETD